ncbi:cysteine rich repeat-containing protein [Bradyrhizobium sp. 157]|uniref:cysteine rich repeat-containing protein n=1 Tax=Bradyrhizobium sp. 157 TaxID=2782631 RepID=UPI001FFBC20F|nr:cysteine rich repeat-containing protein [Bradyrhizobium sp. 157]MCK1638113.1 cysteine rich repeat-containing protein [Bradyrhizobium sp. 157]
MPRFPLSSIPLRATVGLFVVSAAFAGAAAAQAQVSAQMRSEATALMRVCRADYVRLCGGVQPGGGRILACLQSHTNALSAACAQAMPRAQSLKDGAVAAGVMPK